MVWAGIGPVLYLVCGDLRYASIFAESLIRFALNGMIEWTASTGIREQTINMCIVSGKMTVLGIDPTTSSVAGSDDDD